MCPSSRNGSGNPVRQNFSLLMQKANFDDGKFARFRPILTAAATNAASAHASHRRCRWSKLIYDDRREISFSQGAEWNALISRYIGTIPLNGDTPCGAEHIMSAL